MSEVYSPNAISLNFNENLIRLNGLIHGRNAAVTVSLYKKASGREEQIRKDKLKAKGIAVGTNTKFYIDGEQIGSDEIIEFKTAAERRVK